MRLLRFPAVLLLLVLAGGCSGDGDDVEPTASPSEDETTSSTEPSTADGPVAGSGASISPDDADAWCGAITAGQLTALTGFEVVEVTVLGEGVGTCLADLPGVDLDIAWGSEPTRKSQEQYAESWTRPAGVFDVTDVKLPSGQPLVVATQPSPRSATAGTVIESRLLQARVTAVGADESTTVEDLGHIAETIAAVYAT